MVQKQKVLTTKTINAKGNTAPWWYRLERTNEYFIFIKNQKGNVYGEGVETHLHHVIPRYWFGTSKAEQTFCYSSENLIRLSRADHIVAHELLYKVYENPQDQGAVELLKGNHEEGLKLIRKLGAEAVHRILKAEGLNFWNSEFQKEMAMRSLARPDALEIRSKGGKIGGRNRHKNVAISKTDRYLFSYDKNPVLCILNCETGGEVLEGLNSFKPTPLQRVTPLLKGERKSLHGWSCEKLE
jgi:hypothetical protein